MNGDNDCPINPLATHNVYTEGNMEIIAEMIPIDIYRTPNIMENIFVKEDCSPKEIQIYTDLFKEFCNVFSWSYEEIPGIDIRIVKHEIMTYPDVKPIQQKIHPVNPKNAATVMVEVEKLLKVGFIYLIQFTQWVSNPMPFNRK
jgi:hypothetical protein